MSWFQVKPGHAEIGPVPISACPKFKKNTQTKVGYFGGQICSKPFDMSWSHLKPGHADIGGASVL